MTQPPPPPATPPSEPSFSSTGKRVGSFLGWAFLISVGLHILAAPFIHLNTVEKKKQDITKVSISHKIKVVPPTPRPTPKPTPTPPPKQTPPPVKQTQPPKVQKLLVHPPKTTSRSNSGPSEAKYIAPKVGSENGNPNGNAATGPPAPTAGPATPAPPLT
ncbi:MAG: hypothetical protein ACREM2_09465, partial [Vulcanimicrobiaceae bacterium]